MQKTLLIILTCDFFHVTRFVDIIETCHTVPFFIDLIGIAILMSLTLIQVCC